MDPVKIGLIGCGVIGKMHLTRNQGDPLVNFAAVADVREEAVQATAKEFNVPKVFTNAEALIADPEIEGVVLALPTGLRSELALKAFQSGKHVLVEKPAAMNAAEVKQFLKAKKKKQVGACCSCRQRALPSAQVATDYVKTGALGNIRVLRVRGITAAGAAPTGTPPVWRVNKKLNGGGILVNWGVYDLDYMLGILGWTLQPQWVLAQTWAIAPHLAARVAPGSDAENHVTALIRFVGGTMLTYERGEATSTATDNAWQICGEQASLRLNMLGTKPNQVLLDSTTNEKGVETQTLWTGEENLDACHALPIRDFVRAIREQRAPMTSLENALVVEKIIDAIYASADTGKPVRVR